MICAPLPHADGRVPSGLEPALRDTDPRRSWSPHPTCQRSNSRECETKGKLASTDNVSRGERRVDLHSPSQGIHLVIDVRDDQQTHFAEHPISRPPRRLGVGQFPPSRAPTSVWEPRGGRAASTDRAAWGNEREPSRGRKLRLAVEGVWGGPREPQPHHIRDRRPLDTTFTSGATVMTNSNPLLCPRICRNSN